MLQGWFKLIEYKIREYSSAKSSELWKSVWLAFLNPKVMNWIDRLIFFLKRQNEDLVWTSVTLRSQRETKFLMENEKCCVKGIEAVDRAWVGLKRIDCIVFSCFFKRRIQYYHLTMLVYISIQLILLQMIKYCKLFGKLSYRETNEKGVKSVCVSYV